MDWQYKLSILAAVANVVVTAFVIAEILIFRVPPPATTILFAAFSWVLMVLYNPFWKDVWKKK